MHFYRNGNYIVGIGDDGTKIRHTYDDEFVPSFAENVDIKLTDKCTVGCQFCYEGSTPSGRHGDIVSYDFINHLHPYTEMALNGNDMDNPQLDEFLTILRKQEVFPNITVHQNQFIKNYDKIKKLVDGGMVFGVGVSLLKPTENLLDMLSNIPNAVIHTINGILTEDNCTALMGKGVKVLILGYKDMGRGASYLENASCSVTKNMSWLYDSLPSVVKSFEALSFDNLAIEQLNVRRLMSKEEWDTFYMGDDGNFTFYIDMVKGEFAKNSLDSKRYKIGDMSIDDMFNFIRNNN